MNDVSHKAKVMLWSLRAEEMDIGLEWYDLIIVTLEFTKEKTSDTVVPLQ